ncbi:MAG: hypothetical protein ISS81_04990 [Candidatus Marinimicrobia bacterium]|nr:hypothetical protein [Candidatus Neomarinimicrobiota bacterium]
MKNIGKAVIFKLLLSVLIFSNTYGQMKTKYEGTLIESKVDYKLVNVKDFGEGIRKINFKPSSDNSPREPQYFLKYDISDRKKCNIIDAQSLSFASEDFKNMDLLFSPECNYYYTRENLGKVDDYTIKARVKFYKTPNIFLWEKEYDTSYEMEPDCFYISDYNGYVVETNTHTGITKFYNENGELLNDVDLFEKDIFEREKGISGIYSADGNYFILQLQGVGSINYSNGTALILFKSTGELLWKFEPEESRTGYKNVAISNDNSFILSFFFNWGDFSGHSVYLHNVNGTLIRKYNKIGLSHVTFSANNKYAAISFANRFKLINLETGDEVWGRTRYCTGRRNVLDLDISEELGIVILAVGEVSIATREQKYNVISNSRIKIVDFTGKTISEVELPDIKNDPIRSTRTFVSLSENSKKIGLFYGSKYYLYELQNK